MRISTRLRTTVRVATAAALGSALTLGVAAQATAFSTASSTSAHASASANLIAAEAAGSAHASQPARSSANSGATHACPAVIVVGHQSCFALKRGGIHPVKASASPTFIPAGVGYGPSQLQSAYNVASASASEGTGRTIALVDAFDYPSAASDLAAYRSAAGLPAVNFTKVNQNGAASPLPAPAPAGDDWTVEEALDMDMASAICPLCNIVLVEANDDYSGGLYTAQNTAASLAGYISNSWGGGEFSGETSYDSSYFTHASGVVTTAAAGDWGYGTIYPAASPKVISVGGTNLAPASNARGWTESVWSGTGSGCSPHEAQPSWQSALGLPPGCSNRIDNDLAADADPASGVAVYDTYNSNGGWFEVGGTSASSPMIAAMYALGGTTGVIPALDIYQHAGEFNDVTTGSNGTCSPAYLCTAAVGYDGPTGIGTPNGIGWLQNPYDTPLTLINGWMSSPYGTQKAGVKQLNNGIVTFTGAIWGGSSAAAFTLPVGDRPATNVYVQVDMCGATNGRLVIQPSGVVSVQAEGAFSNATCFTSVDGVSYSLWENQPS